MSNIIISKTDSMIRQVKKTLRELENFRLKLEHPYSEDRFDHLLQAADAAEVTCLQLRQMLVACLSTTKEKLLDDIADAQYYSYGQNKLEQAAKQYWETIKNKSSPCCPGSIPIFRSYLR